MSPLVREQFDRHNPDKAKNSRHLLKMTVFLMHELLTAAGIQIVEHLTVTKTGGRPRWTRKSKQVSHGFRKFDTTNMIRAK